ncbi:MAG: helix-turn-helix transcriptional regulator [Halobacteriales archaeon]
MKNDVSIHREQADMSQADLADAVGVSRQTINAIERERYDPSLELAFKLASHFDCQIEELFDPAIDIHPDTNQST